MNYLPPPILLDPLLQNWLLEDIGRGDRTTVGLFSEVVPNAEGVWIAKEFGVVAGLPVAARVFQLLNKNVEFTPHVAEGELCQPQQLIAKIKGQADALLTGERVALNLAMSLSGIATFTHQLTEEIKDLPTRLVDTRKTTPGLRILEKYATVVGGAINHRLGLDDAVMLKDNHIAAAGGITKAIALVRNNIPFPLSVEVETSNLEEVKEALKCGVEIIMLDNMTAELMKQAVDLIRSTNEKVKIEASGNITKSNIRVVAETGVDYISTSAMVTRSTWLDISMKFKV